MIVKIMAFADISTHMSEREVDSGERPEGVRRVESELLGGALDLEREVARFAAMGEPTRFTLLYLLSVEGELASGDLADLLDRHQNDLYHHLDVLEEAGLVGKFREGNSRIYELSPLAESFVPAIFEAIRERAESV